MHSIKHLRKVFKISQTQLSAATGLSQSRISRIEEGKEPSHEEVLRLSEYFGLPSEVVFSENIEAHLPTLEDVVKLRERASAEKKKAATQLDRVAAAPDWVAALLEHYCETVSKINGRPPQEVLAEVEAKYRRFLSEGA